MPSLRPLSQAASRCAGPVTVGARRYIDGGARSHTNADLAKGYDLVVVVALQLDSWTSGGALTGLFGRLDEEVQSLKDGGATVITIVPDDAGRATLAGNLMDFRKRPDAARAGLEQGAALAATLQESWTA